MANDLILLSSGPAGGLAELRLPAVQAGSSIMPGKVNPVIPMSICQVGFAVTGNDVTVAVACQQGQLEINPYEPVIAASMLHSFRLLKSPPFGSSPNAALPESAQYQNKCVGISTTRARLRLS